MLDKYVVFDVETPNSFNDRMSAIGIVVVEDGRIVEEFSTLVNPEAKFHSFHMQLTGITPEDVKSAPTFPELWLAIEPLFRDRLCIAHNAPFDMSVLAKCLQHYQISWRESADYACTCQMGRRCCPELPNHKLNTMCNHLGIPLDHHRAGSDSRACGALLLHYLRCGMDVAPFIRRYDLLRARTISTHGVGRGV